MEARSGDFAVAASARSAYPGPSTLPAASPCAPAPRGPTFTKKLPSTSAIFAMLVRVCRVLRGHMRHLTPAAVFESKNGIHKCRKCGQHFCWCVLSAPPAGSSTCLACYVNARSRRLCGFKDRPFLRNGFTKPVCCSLKLFMLCGHSLVNSRLQVRLCQDCHRQHEDWNEEVFPVPGRFGCRLDSLCEIARL